MPRVAAVREALAQRLPVCDRDFDGVYPSWAQAASPRFWTPVRVALDAAALFEQAGAKSVLDVGSGVGKFAVVAGLASGLDITGVEQRAYLVHSARRAAERYGARVKFVCASIEQVDPRAYDAFYFFNPFGENLVSPGERLDDTVTLSGQRFGCDVERVERWLEDAAVGTSVVTYNGFGGRIPASYDLVLARPAGHRRVRLWTKRRSAEPGAQCFVELDTTVTSTLRLRPRVSQRGARK